MIKPTLAATAFLAGTLFAVPSMAFSPSAAKQEAPAAGLTLVQTYEGSSDRRLRAEEGDDLFDAPGEIVGGVVSGVGGAVSGVTGGVTGFLDDGDDDGEARCARRFRSYNPETGTYRTYSGEVVRCPYL
jgi:hypothetical protein